MLSLCCEKKNRTMGNPNFLKNPLVKFLLAIVLFSLSYILGIHTNTLSSTSPAPSLLQNQQLSLSCLQQNSSLPDLDFGPHHRLSLPQEPFKDLPFFNFCSQNFTHYCPCHDPNREMLFSTERFFHRERHCQEPDKKLRCLIPKPIGYKKPFPWPKSRDYAWFKNVPFKKLTEFKKSQNWVRLEGDLLIFPGGGTSFTQGVRGYVEEIAGIVPLKSGSIRTVLDVGCGVSNWWEFSGTFF